jgi:hypothetical protein
MNDQLDKIHISKIRILFRQMQQCFLIVKYSLYIFQPMMVIIGSD